MNFFLTTICYIFLSDLCEKYQELNISDYNYPTPEEHSNEYTIAILGTNDLHGTIFPTSLTHPLTKENYYYGGVEYLASYVKILRNEWQDRLLWLDSGDQFQGGIESKLSNGTIVTEFLNIIRVNSTAIGNHEWDFGKDFLYKRLEEASFTYLAANIYNETSGKNQNLPNTKVAKIFTLGDIKIGVIGLSTVETTFTTSGDISGIRFQAYRELVINLSGRLRQLGAHAVILNSHVGMLCNLDYNEKMTLTLRNLTTNQKECRKTDEIYNLLESLDEGVIDAVVGGHVHDVVHHWVNKIPVIQSINGGFYSNIIYLTFDMTNHKQLIRDKIQLEGPLPTCEKIFTRTQRCDFIPKAEALDDDTLRRYSFHGVSMVKDRSLDVSFMKLWQKVKQFKTFLAYTEIELAKVKDRENPLGNLMADIIRNKTKADISIINPGAFRVSWYPGNILVNDVWNMCPFDNYITSVDMSGDDVKRMFKILQSGKKGFYQTSGLKMDVTLNPNSLIEDSLKLFNGEDIQANNLYNVATIDFLLPGGGDDFKDVVSWFKSENIKYFGMFRETVIENIKKFEFIKHEMLIDINNKRLNVISAKKITQLTFF
jgi:2',3'-cyclic-nucleotide 2'-phosphodiesterase/3'-nucleotidase/5'-nucleotidase